MTTRFHGYTFVTDPGRVFSPRPTTEKLVDAALARIGDARARIADIGTGSGNLAVAVAKHHKGARVTAVDLSPKALAVAERNAVKHGVAERVRFLSGDLFAPLPAGERFDFILSNPPYIPRDDIAKLAPGVRDYEPHLALDGGPDGYAVLERLVAGARDWLEPGGSGPEPAVVKPHFVAAAIQFALTQGWQPEVSGPPLRIGFEAGSFRVVSNRAE